MEGYKRHNKRNSNIKKRVALIGCGTLGEIIAKEINDGEGNFKKAYIIQSFYDARQSYANTLAEKLGVVSASSLEEILDGHPDLVIEAASKEVVESMAPAILEAGIDMIILSVGALTDASLVEQINEAGGKSGAKLHVASGAIGGFDLMRAVRF